MPPVTQDDLVGRWELTAWETRLGDRSVLPMGDRARGVLLYTEDGSMAVQVMAPGRSRIGSVDPLGGSEQERADAYSGCLAYCGRYELKDERTVVHRIEVSLFPNWIGEEQVRELELQAGELVLRTPPIETPGGTVVSELRWRRARDG